MDCLYQKEMTIPVSMTDASARLGYHDAFTLFMDLAGEHGDALGIGGDFMARTGLFWLTVKTKMRFYRRPPLGAAVTAATWPQAPEGDRFDRSYQMTRDGAVLIAGKTEWALFDTKAGRPRPVDGAYPAELVFDRAPALDAPYARVSDDFSGAEDAGSYAVRPTDVDLGGHMNNAAYLRVLMDLFSNRELKERPIREIDAVFRAPCFEGEMLHIRKQRAGDALDVRMSNGADKTAFLARVAFGEEGAAT